MKSLTQGLSCPPSLVVLIIVPLNVGGKVARMMAGAIHVVHCGNLSPNMGKPLFDCSCVASS